MPIDLRNARKAVTPEPAPLAVRSTRVDTEVPTLDPGDEIEFSTSWNIQLPDRTQIWVSWGTKTKVRPTEDTAAAADRLAALVLEQITARAQQVVSTNQALTLVVND